MSPLKPTRNWLARGFEMSSRVLAWTVVLMVLVTAYDVLARYFFNRGSVALQELEWHLFALVFLLGATPTYRNDGHVRVDLIYTSRRLSTKHREWINIWGNLLCLLPFCSVVVWASLPFVYDAYVHHETSPDPGGLTHRWLIKAAIPVGFGWLACYGVYDTVRRVKKVLE